MTAAAPSAILDTGRFFAVVSDSLGWLQQVVPYGHLVWGSPMGNLKLFRVHDEAVKARLCLPVHDARVVTVVVHD